MGNGGTASREGGGDAGLEPLKGVAGGKALRKLSLGFSPPTLTGPSRVPPPTRPLSLSGTRLPSPLGAVGSGGRSSRDHQHPHSCPPCLL